MKKEFWYHRWQSNQIGFNQSQPNPLLLQYFAVLKLKPGNRVFVPLCGKSIDMLWLASQGYDVVGVELSSIACDAFFNEHSIPVEVIQSDTFTVYLSEKITLLSGDFFDLNKERLGKVDAIFDRAALIALPAELRQRYATILTDLVEPGTPMLLIASTYDQSEMQGPPFSVDENEVMALYGDRFNIKQLYNQPVESIPPHLQEKGLSASSSEVYYLFFKME
jgi:thiopurine S-methyltransferase